MFLLAINTATQKNEIALLKGNKILFEKSWVSQRNEAEVLLPTIQKALRKVKIGLEELEAIFVVAGPGSFSGLRIGITIANALAYSQKVPIFSCDTFTLLEHAIPTHKKKDTAIFLYAGADSIAFKTTKKVQQISLDEFEKFFSGTIRNVIIDLPAEKKVYFQKIARKLGIKILGKNEGRSFGKAVISLLKEKPKAFKEVVPVYLQKPNITQSKKQIFV